jgi:hypothetical protein
LPKLQAGSGERNGDFLPLTLPPVSGFCFWLLFLDIHQLTDGRLLLPDIHQLTDRMPVLFLDVLDTHHLLRCFWTPIDYWQACRVSPDYRWTPSID